MIAVSIIKDCYHTSCPLSVTKIFRRIIFKMRSPLPCVAGL